MQFFLFDTVTSLKKVLGGVLLAVTFFMAGATAYAQTNASPVTIGPAPVKVVAAGTVGSIRIEGTQRIEPNTVQSYLVIKEGDQFDQQRLDQSLKALFNTGLFADVTLKQDGSTLVVNVVENPIINRISFEGNRKIDSDKLHDEIQLKPRTVYTRTRVQADVDRILEIYRRAGRYSARVEPKVILLSENRVDLVFEIDEGPRTPVARINFVGNKEFSDQDLRDIMETKETAWWRFLSSNDTYDPDRLNYDKELLRRFYLAHGYADFRVLSAVAELTPTRDEFFITITLEEGDRYKFGKVTIDPKLKGLKAEPLYENLLTESGDWYNATAVDDTVTALTNAVNQLNYPFVDVKPLTKRDRPTHIIDVVYEIDEGSRTFINRIDIVGNERTVDKVVRREMTVAEGDPDNKSRITQSEQKIKDLGFFSKAKIDSTPGAAPDQTDLKVNLTEQSSGEVSVGAGYSTTDGPLVDFRIKEGNLLGEGKDVSFSTTVSSLEQDFDVGYTEPYFLDRDLAAGFDLYKVTRDLTDQNTFQQEQDGGNFRIGYPLSEHLRQRLNYRIETNQINNVQVPGASVFIQQQEGTRVTSAFGQELAYDQRNSKLDPTKGYIISLDNEAAGAGGNDRYLRSVLSGTVYFPISDDVTLSSLVEGGYILGIDQNVNIADRFFLGGDSFPGFRIAGVGPRDSIFEDSLGGDEYYRGTTDVAFPVGLPDEYGIKGHAFSYYGTLTKVDQSSTLYINPATGAIAPTGQPDNILDNNAIRMSAGLGVSWKSPFGPIRIDVAYPVMKQSYDKTQILRFSFGTKF